MSKRKWNARCIDMFELSESVGNVRVEVAAWQWLNNGKDDAARWRNVGMFEYRVVDISNGILSFHELEHGLVPYDFERTHETSLVVAAVRTFERLIGEYAAKQFTPQVEAAAQEQLSDDEFALEDAESDEAMLHQDVRQATGTMGQANE